MSWPWAKRHPMPEPAEFIRQNTTALNNLAAAFS